MKFRNRRKAQAFEAPVEPAEETLALDRNKAEPGRGRWSTAFLVVGSALLGATAIAFWNRRTIASMRAQIQAGTGSTVAPGPTDEEIF